jgi:hypothetical protein
MNTPKSEFAKVMIPGDQIENEVLSSISDVLGRVDVLDEMIEEAAARLKKDSATDRSLQPKLEKRRQKLLREIGLLTTLNADLDPKDVAQMIGPTKNELKGIDARLAAFAADERHPIQHPSMVVSNVKKLVKDMGEIVKNRVLNARFRNILRLLVESLVFDPKTRTVEMRLSLPSWCLTSTPEEVDVRLATPGRTSAVREPDNSKSLFLGQYHGISEKGHKGKKPKLTLKRSEYPPIQHLKAA